MVTFRLIFHGIFHHWRNALQMYKEYIDTQRIHIFFNITKDPESYMKSFLPHDFQDLLWAKTVSQKMLVFNYVRWRRAWYLGLSLVFWLRTNFLSIWVTGVLYRRGKKTAGKNHCQLFFCGVYCSGYMTNVSKYESRTESLWRMCKIHWVF